MRWCDLWVGTYFFNSIQHVLLVLLGCFVRCEASGHTAGDSFFFKCFVKFRVIPPYGGTDKFTAFENSCFISSERSDFHTVDNMPITVHAFTNELRNSYVDSRNGINIMETTWRGQENQSIILKLNERNSSWGNHVFSHKEAKEIPGGQDPIFL